MIRTVPLGTRFNRLVIISTIVVHEKLRATCKCDCGIVRDGYIVSRLRSGVVKSCGCLRNQITGLRSLKHGESIIRERRGSVEYNIWKGIKKRCLDIHNPYYGGRGISICTLWLNSFDEFLKHIGRRPSVRHSVDRFPNANGNYEPGNVRWATYEQQMDNRSNTRRIQHNGTLQSLTQWALETGIPREKIRARLNRGWIPQKALSK